MSQSRGKPMSMHCFEDVDHVSGKLTRKSQTGILVFCNRAPVMWLSKKHNSVEMLTFRSKFTALKIAIQLVIALRNKLSMFGVTLEVPTDMFCDKETMFNNTSTPEYVLRKKHHSIAYYK